MRLSLFRDSIIKPKCNTIQCSGNPLCIRVARPAYNFALYISISHLPPLLRWLYLKSPRIAALARSKTVINTFVVMPKWPAILARFMEKRSGANTVLTQPNALLDSVLIRRRNMTTRVICSFHISLLRACQADSWRLNSGFRTPRLLHFARQPSPSGTNSLWSATSRFVPSSILSNSTYSTGTIVLIELQLPSR